MECLKVFKWNKKLKYFLFIPKILLLILFFLVYGILIFNYHLIPNDLIGVIYILYVLGISFILTIFTSKLIFREIGFIFIQDNYLVLDVNGKRKLYSKEHIHNLEFHYLGDREWYSSYSIIRKWKSKSRYLERRSELNFEGKLRFDKIVLNGTDLFIKIRNEKERDLFYKIVKWSQDQNLKFKLTEVK